MINCEKCGSVSSVLDSRPVHTTVRRRRRCDSCGHRWTTFEIGRELMLSFDQLPEVLSALSKGMSDLARVNKGIAAIADVARGGQGPVKLKRQLKPRKISPVPPNGTGWMA